MRAALLIFCFCIPLASAGEIYKWTDGSGQVHYSDQPPSDQALVIKRAPAPSAEAGAAQRELAEKDLAFKKRQEEAAKAKEKADADASKQENCELARRDLASANQSGALYTKGPNGETTYVTDQQRAQVRAEAEKYIAENCR
jgi:hypothetical protein